MPRIDWTPGRGRRGRPVRRILGIDQRQGLLILGVLAGVMVLLAGYTLLGGFRSVRDSAFQGTVSRSSGSGVRGSGTGPVVMPTNAAGAAKAVTDSTAHYADMFTVGQQIIGGHGYASMQDFAKAFADPSSPAARFAQYRVDPNPEADTSYLTAFGEAASVLGETRPLAAWKKDMTAVQAGLASWVDTAVRFQQGDATQSDVAAAGASVSASLAAARADAAAVGS
jgi:hypothetical protein